jgi:dTDP-glucose pyrophosphorylase
MAGQGKRFKDKGYIEPKPLISVGGKTMIEWALSSLVSSQHNFHFIFVVQKIDLTQGLYDILKDKGEIISVESFTEGAVNSAMLADSFINNDSPLIIANCDQYIAWNIDDFIEYSLKYDSSVVVFNSGWPAYSYVKINGDLVIEVKEKVVISNLACGGIYFYGQGSYFINGAKELIRSNERTNGEFYISPVFNELIKEGKTVSYFKIEPNNVHMLGTPEEIKTFLSEPQIMIKELH